MNTTTLVPKENRPLCIDFNHHTGGDEAYKQKLISLLIVNLKELQRAEPLAEKQHDHRIFLNTCHKMIFTLSILNDRELSDVVKQLSEPVLFYTDKKLPGIARSLNRVCDELIQSLQNEAAA